MGSTELQRSKSRTSAILSSSGWLSEKSILHVHGLRDREKSNFQSYLLRGADREKSPVAKVSTLGVLVESTCLPMIRWLPLIQRV